MPVKTFKSEISENGVQLKHRSDYTCHRPCSLGDAIIFVKSTAKRPMLLTQE